MEADRQQLRAPVRLVATSSLWVAGFQGLFGDPCGVEIVAVSLTEALRLNDPEVVLIDSGSFGSAGSLREVLQRFQQKRPKIRLIVIGSESILENGYESEAESLYVERLIQAGAKGFLRSSARPDEFSGALQWVRGGSIWAPRQVLSRLVQSSQSRRHRAEGTMLRHSAGQQGQEADKVRFTPREAQVLRYLVGGQCNREIGESLGIDQGTVKAHLGRIMRKTGVANRIELTMYALKEHKPTTSLVGKRLVVVPVKGLQTMNPADQCMGPVLGKGQISIN